jgi:[ribosomal protein S5]-alanine N-acetyltransferase
MEHSLAVHPFATRADYYGMIDYFRNATNEHLLGMGVDRTRLPDREVWFEQAWRDHERAETDPERDRIFLAWLYDGEAVGHSSINQIKWNEQANAHLHLWRADLRQGGVGSEFFRRSISWYFDRYGFKRIFVEPFAENPAPNRVLEKLGFHFIEQYRTIPGPVNFEQDVNRYVMDVDRWRTNETTNHAAHTRSR